MNPEENTNITPSAENFPFPREWIQSNPKKVEGILSRMSLPDQVRCIQLLRGRDQQSLLQLSHQAAKVVQLLPEEDIYFMVKEIGEEDALPVLSIISTPQLQYIFDMEWWRGDKFLPDKAVDWLRWMQKANMEQLVYWVLTEDLDQKIMVLQSLVKVFKRDEMTDSYEGVEGLLHFSPDGVYDIYFKVADIEPVLKDVFQRLYADHQKMFYTLMEGAIWYPVTPTLEQAYRWWSSRVEARGYLPLEEAQGVYSLLSVDALKLDAPAPDAFIEPQSPYAVAPTHPLVDTDPSTFFGQCLAMMKNPERVNAICWELMYLANKVMVADGQDGTNMDTRHEVMRKVLGYVNIGLELGAGGDIAKGEKLANQTWMQSLFQVGYAGVMRLKWEGERLIKDYGLLVEYLLTPGYLDHLAAAVSRFPKIGIFLEAEDPASVETNIEWRNLESVQDIQILENFLNLAKFYARFGRQCLDLSVERVHQYLEEARFCEDPNDLDIVVLCTTAWARFTLFQNIECDPLLPEAGRSFLHMAFLPNIQPGEPRTVDEDRLHAFRQALLKTSLAWTPGDRDRLDQLLHDCAQNLTAQFGRLDPAHKIDWQYTRGLLMK